MCKASSVAGCTPDAAVGRGAQGGRRCALWRGVPKLRLRPATLRCEALRAHLEALRACTLGVSACMVMGAWEPL